MLPFLKHHHQTFSKHHNHSGKQRRQLKISPFKEPRKEIAVVKDLLVNLGIRMKTDQKETNADLSTMKKLVIDLHNEVIFKWPRQQIVLKCLDLLVASTTLVSGYSSRLGCPLKSVY